MKKILVIGAAGQIGTELVPFLRKLYGESNVVASDIRDDVPPVLKDGPYEIIDCLDGKRLAEVAKAHGIDTVYNLAALLSAVAEAKPQLAWKVNMGGLLNILEVARELDFAVFTPSSIGAFGPSSPKQDTPQDTIQRPTSIYGVTKVAGELLCDYYFARFGVDTRGVRYPGIISNTAKPGGGTTDYAVHIYYDALQHKHYTCNLQPGTYLDMMYMPDATRAAVEMMEADPDRLVHRNCFNVAAMSFAPEHICAEICKHVHGFEMGYSIDPVRQAIADSWPDRMDDSAAREEWGWQHEYDLPSMTKDMLTTLKGRL
ncbi:MAG: L-threonine 3-dehydrogenase [Candidatus Cloacimonetes bacterium]|nr:L-threonine 3-dehydrogenase [Candidatus Cloacimonadota bacterium]